MTAAESGDAGSATVSAYSLALNYLPFAQIALGAVVVWSLASSAMSAIGLAIAWIYLVPPLVCRLTIAVFGRPSGRALRQDSRAYKVWWFIYQWQVLHNRVPWLEEVLRLVPGLYAAWLCLWGGRVSPLAYWAPGSLAFDRPLVVVERGALIGAGAGLVGHAGTLAADGSYQIDIGPARVGRGAIMGARSGLSAGAELADNTMLPAGRLIRPFTHWDGRVKQRIDEQENDNHA